MNWTVKIYLRNIFYFCRLNFVQRCLSMPNGYVSTIDNKISTFGILLLVKLWFGLRVYISPNVPKMHKISIALRRYLHNMLSIFYCLPHFMIRYCIAVALYSKERKNTHIYRTAHSVSLLFAQYDRALRQNKQTNMLSIIFRYRNNAILILCFWTISRN